MSTIATSSNSTLIADTAAQAAEQGNAVVLHDIAAVNAESDAKAITNVREAITKLVADKQAWEANAYRTSNEQLYALLARCYSIYVLMTANRRTAAQLREEVDAYLKSQNVKLSDSAHTITKIVKCVFGADRRRVSAYSIALRAAIAANVPVSGVAAYIRDKGGVEELRLSRSPNAMTPKSKAEAGKGIITRHVMGTIKLDALSEHYDAAKLGCQHVLIVTQADDGAFEVNAMVSSSTAVNAALAAFYAQQKHALQVKEAEQVQATADVQLHERIAEAAAAAVLQ